MTMSMLDAFDLVASAELLEARLEAAAHELGKRPGLSEEKAWLASAHRHVARAREGIGDLLTRVLRLDELEPVRGDRGRALQGAVVDAAEHLFAAIASAGGERSPLLEAIFRNLKLPLMRRCGRDELEKFCSEIEARLGTGYVRRMLADETYAAVAPALERLRSAFADWRSIFTSAPLPEAEANALRSELEGMARRLDVPCRQARLLAEAALLPAKDVADASGIFEKPKRRGARGSRAESDTPKAAPPASEPRGGARPDGGDPEAAPEPAAGE